MATDVWDMSDAELEAAFREAKGELETQVADQEYVEEYVEEELEEVEDLEQPDEDSDDDASADDVVEEEADDSSEVEEDLDGDADEVEEELEEVEKETAKEVQPVQRQKFKANGKEYEFTMDEIVSQFPKVFGQAMDYTRKTQAMKPWRKTIDAIEGAQLKHEDVSLMIDVLKGDKGAIAEVLRRTKVDSLDLDMEEAKYTPKDYGRDENTLAIHDVIDEISRDAEYATTNKILSKEWDDKSFAELTKDPEMIRLLHIDVKSGTYNKVQPIAEKLKVYDRGQKSDLEYYADAAKMYFADMDQEKARLVEADRARAERESRDAEKARIAQVRAEQQKAKAVKQESVKRKAAAPTKSRAGTQKATNYLDTSDEAFEDWYKSLQERM